MNFKANENLDTDVTGKIRDRYFAKCFSYVERIMNEMFHKMAANTIETANTMLNLHDTSAYGHGPSKKQLGTPGHTGSPETHHNHTDLQTTSGYGHVPPKKQKMYAGPGTVEKTGIPGTFFPDTSGYDTHVHSMPNMTFFPTHKERLI